MSTPTFPDRDPQQPFGQQPPPGYGQQQLPNRQQQRAAAQAEKAHRKATRLWYKKKRFILPLALLAFVFFVNVLNGNDPGTTTAEPATTSTNAPAATEDPTEEPTEAATDDGQAEADAQAEAEAEADAQAEAEAKEKAEEAKAKEKAKEEAAKPKISREQENAIRSAESYLDLKGFSRDGLIEQLSSDYGDGFPRKVATAAVDSMDINYKEQAARAAESYLDLKGFSCKGLIEQLSSEYGDQYTRVQAEYGARKAGVC